MLVMTIVGILIGTFIIYWFVIEINKYSEKKYNYEFFNFFNYLISAVGYVLIYYGNKWYISALENNLDILNGQILIWIGATLIISVVFNNIANTSFIFGLILSIVQLILYAVLAVVGFFVLLLMIAFFSQTRPVYNVNK